MSERVFIHPLKTPRYEASKLDFLEELLMRNMDHCAEYIVSLLDFEVIYVVIYDVIKTHGNVVANINSPFFPSFFISFFPIRFSRFWGIKTDSLYPPLWFLTIIL